MGGKERDVCSVFITSATETFRAEAEKMRMKASAYKQYGDAAILSLVLEALPQVSISFVRTQFSGQALYKQFAIWRD